MKMILSKVLGRASDLADVEPLIALFLGAALLAVFLSALFKTKDPSLGDEGVATTAEPGGNPSLPWLLYGHVTRLLWAVTLVALLAGVVCVLRTYLRQTVGHFQRTHGRVTEANYNAVQTIWGAEQAQGELNVALYDDEEITERIESEDLTKPAVLRKKTVRKFAPGNPFVSARHEVTLKQNPRKKGSAFYGGYETDCRFTWKLKNPDDAAHQCSLTFPLPADGAMYDAMKVTLNGEDVLPQMRIQEGALTLTREVQASEALDLAVAFTSRGVSYWYFQVREAREIRDFRLTLSLPDLAKAKLNYPEGCMTPTDIQSTADGQGSVLTFHLDHALSNKGMGIALPELPQPGATTRAVLDEAERAWLLIFALLALSLTLLTHRHAVFLAVSFGAATAFAYGLLADFSDLLFGFWGTAVLVFVPLVLVLAALLRRIVQGQTGQWLALQTLVYAILYPALAGMDPGRQTLYLNLCALGLLAFAAVLWVQRFLLQPSGDERRPPRA